MHHHLRLVVVITSFNQIIDRDIFVVDLVVDVNACDAASPQQVQWSVVIAADHLRVIGALKIQLQESLVVQSLLFRIPKDSHISRGSIMRRGTTFDVVCHVLDRVILKSNSCVHVRILL